jgi:hypothetical protein
VHHSVPYLVAALLVTACAGDGEGLDANGRPIDEGGGGGGTDDLFLQIQDTIFTPVCTGCHAGASAPQGLRLDAGNSYALLVGVASNEVPSLQRVAPGDPDASYLVQKVEGTAAVGGRMPLGGPPLPQESIDLIRQWIAAGAPATVAAVEQSQSVLRVVSTIPAADETLDPYTDTRTIIVVFNRAIDASIVDAGVFSLFTSGGDGSFAEGNETALPLVNVEVMQETPHVARLNLRQPLLPESYQLVVRGSGAVALADIGSQVMDGDGDGLPGGDHTLVFEITGVTP